MHMMQIHQACHVRVTNYRTAYHGARNENTTHVIITFSTAWNTDIRVLYVLVHTNQPVAHKMHTTTNQMNTINACYGDVILHTWCYVLLSIAL